MRQLSPSTNLFLAVLAGFGLLGSLSLAWFAAPVPDPVGTDGPVETFAFHVSKVFAGDPAGPVSGADALGSARAAIVVLVAVVALAVLAVSVPAIRRQAEDFLRLVVLASPVVVLVAAVVHPGTTTPVTMHSGVLVSLACTAFMGNAAWHGANLRERRAAPARPRYSR